MRETNRHWSVSSRTLRVSHTMGLPSCFLCGPSSCALPKSIDNNVGAYIPRSRGEARWQPKRKERGSDFAFIFAEFLFALRFVVVDLL